ncbi:MULTISPECIES: HAMP domain-containing sensor histidine kinase [unclassified Fusibacter]|uniref:sensor histidine kinase n=1 Tax=unclassified Fusibacter TaxID=2624464 RepID=UPI001010C10A|nr:MULTISPECIES: HAMP domain-containing sensor histidine kinase [unclassified Fusibacter]MCK8061599.1 HAMP domain-containing histidine kinase [Fusibacter sp. A2]NPE23782.1 HAMP domain-containing protein [Fusibacter sp. A1]RXV58687.1 sensor histidine kinase [Fusibacter sp. A1]
MIKKSITLKLFILIFMLFLFQSLIQVGFQKYFLADYYELSKIDEVDGALSEAIETFSASTDLIEQKEILETYMAVTGEPILVYDDYYDYHPASYQVAYEKSLTLADDQNTLSVVPIDEFVDPNLESLILDYTVIGQPVVLSYYEDDTSIFPYSLILGDELYYLMFEEEVAVFEEEEYELKESAQHIVDYQESFIDDEMFSKINAIDSYFYGDEGYVNPMFEFIEVEKQIDGQTYYFVSMVALQPINDVLAVQNKFQWYVLAVMLVMTLFIAVAVSKLISKPIVKLSRAADAYAKMDFEESYAVKREDEIGMLGSRINYLANSLKDRIDELGRINVKLEDDIEFERRQEELRKEFVSNVSHELKTPLGVIKSYAEGIRDGISKDREEDYLQVIIDEVAKMNELVIDMLELTSLEANHQLAGLEQINLKRMISNVLRRYDQTIEEKDLHVTVQMEDASVFLDVKKMELVIGNLLSNAFRYVDERRLITVTLKGEQEITTLEIENSCSKLTEEDLGKIWDRFYRIEKSRSRELGGNGLGLAIVRHVLDLHGFDYRVINSDIGFKFILTIK